LRYLEGVALIWLRRRLAGGRYNWPDDTR